MGLAIKPYKEFKRTIGLCSLVSVKRGSGSIGVDGRDVEGLDVVDDGDYADVRDDNDDFT